jgi:hypothetical protein
MRRGFSLVGGASVLVALQQGQEAIYSASTEEEENDFSHLNLSEEEDERQSATASNQHNTVDHFNRYENVGNFLTYLSDYSIESVGDEGDSATFNGDGGDRGNDRATFCGGQGDGFTSAGLFSFA